MHAHVVTDSIDIFFFRKCKARSIQIAREKGRTNEVEGGRGSASRKRDRFSTYPRISWIDSSTFCRSERSDEQIVRKSWNAPFIGEECVLRETTDKYVASFSAIVRRGFLKRARNAIFIEENQEIALYVFSRGCLQLLFVS